MWDVLLDTLIDSLKMLPFLFGAYLLLEYIEHRSSDKLKNILAGSGKFGAFWGSLLGAVPQCGFSVAAANLYAGRVITLGTLAAVFLSTSDEAVPILLANPGSLPMMFKLILYKIVIAVIAGFAIDLFIRMQHREKKDALDAEHEAMHEVCHDCDCEHGILKATLKHTAQIFVFILIVSLALNALIAVIGEERLSVLLMSNSIFQPAIAALFGFIPNCAASVVLTQLFISGTLSFGSAIAGLCTSAGIGLLVLFKTNRHLKENLGICLLLFAIATAAGMLIQGLGL